MRGSRWLRRLSRLLLWLLALVYLATPFLLYFSLVQVIAANADPTAAQPAVVAPASQDPSWVAAKLDYKIMRPTPPGTVLPLPACVGPCASYPAAYELDTRVVQNTLEPAKVGTDAAGHAYSDHNMSKLCGPGAVANTLYFWGKGPSTAAPATFVDTANGVATYWTTDHDRAYILSLAWKTAVPGWPHPGLMDTHDPSWGVTLYGMRDGLNWEASGHDAGTWHTYFYTLVWSNRSSAAEFHQQVTDDIANAHVPVVAEVSARLLPNWAPQGNTIYHLITVVGYDDTKGIYYYTDTCGHSTGCGSLYDGGVHTVPQGQLWGAIGAIPVNTSTAYNAGDGGYVW
ncbi:MAG TPA: C39 family peptidase [Ktedonobacterales bacterium]|jgi:Peptidase_C39 like family|nr:C39 family peptidase [Ktedonobacterales bacterium]